MTKKRLMGGVAIAAAATVLATVGGLLARAGEPGAVNPPAASNGPGAQHSFADIVQTVAPAVVSIDVESKPDPSQVALQRQGPFSFQFGGAPGDDGQDNPFGFSFRRLIPQAPDGAKAPPQKATGSGFFISADGYIVTNNHVIEDAQKITVRTKDGRSLKATLVGHDPATDLAVVKVEGKSFPFVSFEDRGKPRVGDWVVAVGNPFGLGGTATAGIVSALDRPNVSGSNYVDFMQIDAPINRGNSGGPTFDTYGRVVGVNTAIFSPSGGSVGIGFDIPADIASRVTQQLIAHGKVTRGYIGATVQAVTPDIAGSLGLSSVKGALIAEVVPGGPSDEAGLKSGDLVTAIDGRSVASATDLTRQVAMIHPGDTARLQVWRDGHTQAVTLRAGLRPSEASLAGADGAPDGGDADDASATLGMRLAPKAGGGLTIEGLAANSDAQEKGLRRGDVILRAGDSPLATPSDLVSAEHKAKALGRSDVLLLVAHGDRKFFVPIQMAKAQG
ncbi:Do family serine endopeptidase [Caulobacter sp. KR2-114]|uniref:Do family serine endopeptidase n=1 Tax=Caulobacter sp. KR2-114 TaxID=3400912 RepID=UPI003C08B79F